MIKMLEIIITPTSLVFKNLDYEMMNTLQDKFAFTFTLDGDEFKITGEPQYLFKSLYLLSCDYEIELN